MSKPLVLNLLSLLFCSIISIILKFQLDCWSNDSNIIQQSALAYGSYSEENINYNVYFGYRGFLTIEYVDVYIQKKSYQEYGNRCGLFVCRSCRIAGLVSNITHAVSLVILLFVILFTILRIYVKSDTSILKILTIVSSLLLWISLTVSFGYWDDNCFKKIQNGIFRSFNVYHYYGFYAILFAWFLCAINIIMHVIIPSNNTIVSSEYDQYDLISVIPPDEFE